MSNRSSSKNHGHAFTSMLRKKSIQSKRKNKELAAIRRIERQERLESHYKMALSKIA